MYNVYDNFCRLLHYQNLLYVSVVDLVENTMLALIFPSGSVAGTQRCTDIVIVDDTCAEPTEVFSVAFSAISADGVETDGGMEQAMVSIDDNDSNKTSCLYIDISSIYITPTALSLDNSTSIVQCQLEAVALTSQLVSK